MNNNTFSDAVLTALTTHVLRSLGKGHIVPDKTLMDRMRAEYTFIFTNGEFSLVPKGGVK